MDTSDVLASSALLLSVTVFLWNIIRDFWTDRVHLRLKVMVGRVERSDGYTGFMEAGSSSDPRFTIPAFSLTLINDGRHPVYVNWLGVQYGYPLWERILLFWRKRPETHRTIFEHLSATNPEHPEDPRRGFWLQPFGSRSEALTDLTPVRALNEGRVRYFFAEDSRDKVWRSSRKTHRRILNGLKKLPGSTSAG